MFGNNKTFVFISVLGTFLLMTALCSAQTNYVAKYSTNTGVPNTTSSLIYDNGTDVGIGTTTPLGSLDIAGANPSLMLHNYSGTPGAGNSPNLTLYSAEGSSSAPTATMSQDNIGQVAAAGYNGLAFPGTKVKIQFMATENWGTTANGTAISFQTTANTTTNRTERMRIDNTGYVGIGTATPGANLPGGLPVPPSLLEVSGDVVLTEWQRRQHRFPRRHQPNDGMDWSSVRRLCGVCRCRRH